jgi:hypothetical protein
MGGCGREPAPITNPPASLRPPARLAWSGGLLRASPRDGPESVPRERHSDVAGETIFAPHEAIVKRSSAMLRPSNMGAANGHTRRSHILHLPWRNDRRNCRPRFGARGIGADPGHVPSASVRAPATVGWLPQLVASPPK